MLPALSVLLLKEADISKNEDRVANNEERVANNEERVAKNEERVGVRFQVIRILIPTLIPTLSDSFYSIPQITNEYTFNLIHNELGVAPPPSPPLSAPNTNTSRNRPRRK